MAITSANHIHGNSISHPGINICQGNNNNSGTPFGTTDDQSGNTNSHKTNGNNICQYKHQQMETISPSAIKITKQLAIRSAKQKT